MSKIAYIFGKKAVKSRQRRGSAPRTSIGLRRLGAEPPDSRVVTAAY